MNDKNKQLRIKNNVAIESKYNDVIELYSQLGDVISKELEDFIRELGIGVASMQHRVKELPSFLDKIERKRYSNPFTQIEDICGVRVVCFYKSDMEKIAEIIEREFDVKSAIDKNDQLNSNEFGYNSLHFVVEIKKEWFAAPQYKKLKGMRAEIQVRTLMMHAWADIEHKLAYKKESDIPAQFKRKFSRLSALLEIADDHFDQLRNERENYQKSLKDNQGGFDMSLPLNVDTLQAFLDFYFPSRKRDLIATRRLLTDLKNNDINFNIIHEGWNKIESKFEELEKSVFVIHDVVGDSFGQTGAVRWILLVTHSGYSVNALTTPPVVKEIISKWRTEFEKNKPMEHEN
jgi:ppGpp synthetase/RelA/SpoT-type nucleotidyltranferase